MAGRINIKNFRRVKSFFKRNGLEATYYKVLERLSRDKDEMGYTLKVKREKLPEHEIFSQKNQKFEKPYLISVLVPVYEPDEEIFVKMLESVASQTYTNWELCLADAGKSERVYGLVQDFISRHSLDAKGPYGESDFRKKVKYKHIEKNRGISANLNEALNMASGQYVAFLDHDDAITNDALYEIISVLNRLSSYVYVRGKEKIRFIYSDEDKVSYNDKTYFDYHRKTDFDRVMLLTNNYICHLNVVETSLAREVDGFDPDYDGSQDFDFVLRCAERLTDAEIVHIPKVLYHWRSSKKSTAENPDAKLYAYEAGRRAVAAHLSRQGISAEVKNTAHLGFFEVDFAYRSDSIKRMNESEFLLMCKDDFEAIKEEYIFVLPKDADVISENIEEKMVAPMCLDYVGATCGKVLVGNKIESAGYVLNKSGGLDACCAGLNEHFSGYMHRAAILRSVHAYYRDFVMLKKSALVWKDSAPCIKEGYSCVYVPSAVIRGK